MTHAIFAFTLFSLLTSSGTWAQTSPARLPATVAQGNAPETRSAQPLDDMPLADYLGLLRQIAPAAEAGARDYLAAIEQRCGRTLSAMELRRAISQGDGAPVLMGLIRANHLSDAAERERLVRQIRCPDRKAR